MKGSYQYDVESRDALHDKWSTEIIRYGYTVVPNLLFMYRSMLHINSRELLLIITLEKFRWLETETFPTIQTVAYISGLSPRTIMRSTATLEQKMLLKVLRQPNRNNRYDITPLRDRLHDLFMEYESSSVKKMVSPAKSVPLYDIQIPDDVIEADE